MVRNFSLAVFMLCAGMSLQPAAPQEKQAQTIKGWGTLFDLDGDCRVVLDSVHAINTTTAAFEPVLEDLKLEQLKGKAK